MKRFTFIAVALCLAFAMAAPAMAVDVDVSGSYRVRGSMTQSETMLDTAATNAYMDMRFRLSTVFKVSDDLRFTTRLDALDKKFADTDTPAAVNDDNIDFDRGYMTFVTAIGKFDIGRMSGGTWATSFIDTVGERDRIKFTTVAGPFTLLGIFEKNVEGDDFSTTADQDADVYYGAFIYKTESWQTGALAGHSRNATNPAGRTTVNLIIPYFTGKWGAFRLQAEARINDGTLEVDGATDVDLESSAFNIEGGFNMGAIDLELGYAFISGDDGTDATKLEAFGNVGDDWEKLFLMVGSTGSAPGASGNLSATGAGGAFGASILYGGVSFVASDTLKLGLVAGWGTATDTPAGFDDDYGAEVDLKLNYKLMDNLNYSAVAAFWSAGDFYWLGAATEPAGFDDVSSIFHALTLSF